MADVIYITSRIIDGENTSTSRSSYQFQSYLFSEHNTTVITNSNFDDKFVSEESDVINIPAGLAVWTLFSPILAILYIIVNIRETDIIVTNRSGIAILPAAILNYILPTPWVIFCNDSPDLLKTRLERRGLSLEVGTILYQLMDRIAWHGYRKSDRIILSDDTDFFDESRKTIIPGGVDCKKIDEIQESMNVSQKEYVKMVYVGNMYYHRGVDILLNAVSISNSDIKLILVGPPPEAGGEDTLQEFRDNIAPSMSKAIDQFEINAEYEGRVPHNTAVQKMICADIGICILPLNRGMQHYNTSYPIKIFEYMYTNNAIISTNTKAMTKILNQEQLVENSASSIANKIDEFATNSKLRSEYKNKNKILVRPYCWSHLWEEIESAIKSEL